MNTSRPRPGTSCSLHADIMTHVQLTWSRKRCVNGLAVWRTYKTPLTARRLIAIAIWHSRVQRNLAQCWKSYSKRGVLKFPDWGGDQKRTVPDSRWKFQVQFVSFSKKIGLGWLSDSLCSKRPCLKMKENPKPNLRQKILRSEDISTVFDFGMTIHYIICFCLVRARHSLKIETQLGVESHRSVGDLEADSKQLFSPALLIWMGQRC